MFTTYVVFPLQVANVSLLLLFSHVTNIYVVFPMRAVNVLLLISSLLSSSSSHAHLMLMCV